MKEAVEIHIAELLHYHDCVIVPGLGAFVANHRSAVIAADGCVFMPPCKEIGFNRSLHHNDGLLISHIAMKFSIPYVDAAGIVESFVIDIRDRINAGETVSLGEVGILRYDAIGNILFEANDSKSFLPEAFGLSSFRFEPLDYKHIARIESGRMVNEVISIRSPWYYRVAAAMVAGFFVLSTFNLNTPDMYQAGVTPSFKQTVNYPVEAIQTVAIPTETVEIYDNAASSALVQSSPAEIQTDEVLASPEVVTTAEVIKSSGPYHIIAASFVEAGPAAKAVAKYKAEGFEDAKVLADKSGRHRIAIKSFSNRDEAVMAMNELRKESRFASVWVHLSR